MGNILIIKTGAAGDVVRTTCLLRVLKGDIFWVTAEKNKALLPDNDPQLSVLTLQEAAREIANKKFELVMSLEEDLHCAAFANKVIGNELVGVYLDGDKISYTDSSSGWYDMSRVSKLGMIKANLLKAINQESYQSHLFKMIGRKFQGERYRIFGDDIRPAPGKIIGIEKRTGRQWPDKQWWGYDELSNRLKVEGHSVHLFRQRTDVRDYLRDIARCNHIISGDTLAMHLALAYSKTCTTIFNCTSHHEIYDYGLLKKVVSPLLSKYFYTSTFDKEAIDSVSLEAVYETLPLRGLNKV
jgi:lipopolysaccharide heptosyltransferase II